MDILISPLEQAVMNAVNLLSRTRVRRGGPFYLLKPQGPIGVTVMKMTPDHLHAIVGVSCVTWGPTLLTLDLSGHHGIWTAWGDFTITYAQGYPVASLFGRSLAKSLYPMYATNPNADRFMELRIRSRVRPGR